MSNTYPTQTTPLGVAILAILIGILGFFLLLGGLLVGLLGLAFPAVATHLFLPGLLGAALLVIFGLILLLVARGLWDLELWALAISVIVVGLAWISDLLAGDYLGLGAIILLLVLIYLIAVSGQFR